MDIEPTEIPGCFVLHAGVMRDERGIFVKTFHGPRFQELGLRTDWQEEYFSASAKNVIRGMHFQRPPADHAKMVFCLAGEVLDVVVDLRLGSPVYGIPFGFTLNADNGRGLYLPTGCAHGFASRVETSVMYYKVTSIYSPEHDDGIAWDSIGYEWPVSDPLVSDRDIRHTNLANFESPFAFEEKRTDR